MKLVKNYEKKDLVNVQLYSGEGCGGAYITSGNGCNYSNKNGGGCNTGSGKGGMC